MNTDRVMAGIGLGVLAYALFSVHDATNKYLVGFMPVWQVLFFRSITIVVICLGVGRGKLLTRLVETPLKVPLAARGLLTLTAWLCYFTAARALPLAQLLTVYFSAPILTTLLARPLLGEHVTPTRWASVLIGFVGVVIAMDPVGMTASWPMLLVLAAAAIWGYGIILMRQIARKEPSLLQMLVQNLTFLVLTGARHAYTSPTPRGIPLQLLSRVRRVGGIGHGAGVGGSRLAPAAVMSAMEYSSLLWAFGLGYLIFGDVPTLPVWIGAATITASGVLLVMSERRART